MKNKKALIIVIAILLVIAGVTLFVFTRDKEPEPDNQNQPVQQDKVPEQNPGSDVQDKEEENKGNSTSSNTKNYYNEALEAVKKAESELSADTLKKAQDLVTKVGEKAKKDELQARVDNVSKAISTRDLVETLYALTFNAQNKKEMDDARTYLADNDIQTKVDELTFETLKENLAIALDEAEVLLSDTTNPTIEGIEDGTFTNKDVLLSISDDNEYKILVNDKEVDKKDLDFTKEQEYAVTVIDRAFNETSLVFTVDKTAPLIEGVTDEEITNLDVTLEVSDANQMYLIKNDGEQEVITETTLEFTESGKYEIKVVDDATNEASITFTIDKIGPSLIIDGVKHEPTDEPIYVNAFFNGEVVEDLSTLKSAKIRKVENDAPVEPDDDIWEDLMETLEFRKTEEGKYELVLADKFDNESIYTVIIDIDTPTISGVTNGQEANEALTIKITEKNIDTVTLNGEEITYNSEEGIKITQDGLYELTVTDKVGNSVNVKFSVDAVGPTLTINGEEHKPTSDDNVIYMTEAFEAVADDMNGVTSAKLNSGEVEITEDELVTFSGEADGKYVIELTDGKQHTSKYTIIIDTIAPSITGIPEEITNQSVTPVITDANPYDIVLTKDGQKIEYTEGAITDDGDYVLTVTDKAGNSTTVTFTIDTTGPSLTVNGVKVNGEEKIQIVGSFTAEATDKHGVKKIVVNGKEVTEIRGEEPKSGEEPKTYTIVLTDEVGNESTYTIEVVADAESLAE